MKIVKLIQRMAHLSFYMEYFFTHLHQTELYFARMKGQMYRRLLLKFIPFEVKFKRNR